MKSLMTLLIAFFFSFTLSAQVTIGTLESIDSVFIDDAIVMDDSGNLYGAHFTGNRIYKRSSDGTFSVYASGLNTPNGMDFDSAGNLFVADHSGNKLYKILPDGTKVEHLSNINRPSGVLKMEGSDTMIVTRYAANMILKVAPDAHIDTLASGGMLNGPVGLAYDDNGRLFTANFNDRKLIEVTPDGDLIEIAQFPQSGWLGFMTYANGFFYGTSYNNHKIYQIRQSDNLISLLAGTVLGEVDGDASVARFHQPNGIVFNEAKDTLFISAYGTGNVRYITNLESTVSVFDPELSPEGVNIYPNPAVSDLNIQFSLTENKAIGIKLLQPDGKVLKTGLIEGIKGEQTYNWSIGKQASGLYFVAFEIDGYTYLKSVLVAE